MQKLRILHTPANIAGQASVISEAQRELGLKSTVAVFNTHKYNYHYDINLNRKTKLSTFKILIFFIKSIFRYDIFHYHYNSLLPFYLDLYILKLFRKKTFMHYWGSDIRQSDIAKKYVLFFNDLRPADKINISKIDNLKRRKIHRANKWTTKTIVGDYSLLPYSPNSVVIKQAINLKKFPFVGVRADPKIINIVHAPSNPELKGTKYILEVIKTLQAENYPIRFILLENKSNTEVISIIRNADIVIDQLLGETHGIFALESMALGKPVICRIHKNIYQYTPDLPIINANPETLYSVLKNLLENPSLRQDIVYKSRYFVEKIHDSRIIAKKLLKLYQE